MLNCYEESLLKNSALPSEWQSQSSLDEFLSFLQSNWDQRYVLFEDNKLSKSKELNGNMSIESTAADEYTNKLKNIKGGE